MKKLLLSFIIAFSLAFGAGNLLSAPVSAADPTDAAKTAVCQGVSGTGAGCASGGLNLTKIAKAVLNIISIIAGVVSVFMIIFSGMKYITSSGDQQAVASAKRTLIYAIVGLAVVAVSQIIVRFVLYQLERPA